MNQDATRGGGEGPKGPAASDAGPALLPPDPFGPTSDPRHYVSRRATEDALRFLERGVRRGTRPMVLCGEPGIGKTMLLRVLTVRLLDDFLAVYLPHAAVGEEEILPWILGLMEQPLGGDAERSLVDLARRFERSGSALVLLVDDAECIPPATLGRLTRLAREIAPALRLVLATHDEPRLDQMLAVPAETVCLRTAMSHEESDRYIEAHLARSELAPGMRERLDTLAREEIHRAAKGVPRPVGQYASECLFGFRGDRFDAPEEVDGPVASEEPEAPVAEEAPGPSEPEPEVEVPWSDPAPLRNDVAAAGVRDRVGRGLRAIRSLGAIAAAVVAAALLGVMAWRLWPTDASPNRTAQVAALPAVSAPATQPVAEVPPAAEVELRDVLSRMEREMGSGSAPEPVAAPPGAAPAPPPQPEPAAESSSAAPLVDAAVTASEPAEAAAEPAVVAAPAPILVSINAQPWARVELDGVEIGLTPMGDVPVAAGRHTFRAHMPDGRVLEREVLVDERNWRVIFR